MCRFISCDWLIVLFSFELGLTNNIRGYLLIGSGADLHCVESHSKHGCAMLNLPCHWHYSGRLVKLYLTVHRLHDENEVIVNNAMTMQLESANNHGIEQPRNSKQKQFDGLYCYDLVWSQVNDHSTCLYTTRPFTSLKWHAWPNTWNRRLLENEARVSPLAAKSGLLPDPLVWISGTSRFWTGYGKDHIQ